MSKPNIKAPQKLQQRNIYERINFLSEISKVAALDEELICLSQYLGTEMDLTAKKSKIRLSPKRMFCKKCKSPLIPPTTADISYHSDSIIVKCKLCNYRYCFHQKEKEITSENKHWTFQQELQNEKLVLLSSSNND